MFIFFLQKYKKYVVNVRHFRQDIIQYYVFGMSDKREFRYNNIRCNVNKLMNKAGSYYIRICSSDLFAI